MCETTSVAEYVCKHQVVVDTRKRTVVELKQAFRNWDQSSFLKWDTIVIGGDGVRG